MNETEHVAFLVRWWQEILGGVIITLTGWFLRSKGKRNGVALVPMSEEEIEHRMTICKQAILLSMKDIMHEHELSEKENMDARDERLLNHIKDILSRE